MASRRALVREATGSLHPFDVLARARAPLPAPALLDEQRHLDLGAGLQDGGLERVGPRVAIHPGLGLRHGQRDRRGEIHAYRHALVHRDLGGGALGEPSRAVSDDVHRHRYLVVGLEVHEREHVSVAVQELHLLAFDDREAHLHTGVERALDHGSGLHVAQIRADERAALAGLHVLELHDMEERSVKVQRHAVLQVVRRYAHSTTSSLVLRGISRHPSAVTSIMSSIRTPPSPGMYTPGSIVTTAPCASSTPPSHRMNGASWISRPTPWPRPCGYSPAWPASRMTLRAAASTSTVDAPARAAAIPARWAAATRSWISRRHTSGSPNATVRVMSEW